MINLSEYEAIYGREAKELLFHKSLSMKQEGASWQEIGDFYGISPTSLRDAYRKRRSRNPQEVEVFDPIPPKNRPIVISGNTYGVVKGSNPSTCMYGSRRKKVIV